ncbi:MAG: hypothetical protein FWD76_05825, partial [Firmicutes bacterium]|nr:hypothetical protein [Bacillota bacterium]
QHTSSAKANLAKEFMANTLNILKQPSCAYVTGGGILYYQVVVQNLSTDYYATQMTLTDTFGDPFVQGSASYSLDGGASWFDWTGSLSLDDLAPLDQGGILFRAVVSEGASGTISNTAEIQVTFCTNSTAPNFQTPDTGMDVDWESVVDGGACDNGNHNGNCGNGQHKPKFLDTMHRQARVNTKSTANATTQCRLCKKCNAHDTKQ